MRGRVSPLHEALKSLRPVWGELQEMTVPLYFKSEEREREIVRDLALADLSALPKMGLKGPQAETWLWERGLPVPPSIYSGEPLEGAGLIVRVDRTEFFLEEGLSGTFVSGLSGELSTPVSGVYPISRQDGGLLVCGERSHRVLAQTCGICFDSAPAGLIMTRVAGVSCALLPFNMNGAAAFRIWCVPSYAGYLWETLLEIVEELGGAAVGVACLASLKSPFGK